MYLASNTSKVKIEKKIEICNVSEIDEAIFLAFVDSSCILKNVKVIEIDFISYRLALLNSER